MTCENSLSISTFFFFDNYYFLDKIINYHYCNVFKVIKKIAGDQEENNTKSSFNKRQNCNVILLIENLCLSFFDRELARAFFFG